MKRSLIFILALTACSGDPDSQPSSAGLTMAALAARCGDSPARLDSLLERGAERLQRQRGISMEPDVLAAIVATTLPEGPPRDSCAPKIDTLVLSIMQSRAG